MNVNALKQIREDFDNFRTYIADFNCPGRYLSVKTQIGAAVRRVLQNVSQDTKNEIIRQCQQVHCDLSNLSCENDDIGLRILFPDGKVVTNVPLCNSHRCCILEIVYRGIQNEIEDMCRLKTKRILLRKLRGYFEDKQYTCDSEDKVLQEIMKDLNDLDDEEINQYLSEIETARTNWNFFITSLFFKSQQDYWENSGKNKCEELIQVFSENGGNMTEVKDVHIGDNISVEKSRDVKIGDTTQSVIGENNRVAGSSTSKSGNSNNINIFGWVYTHPKICITIGITLVIAVYKLLL